MHGNCPSPAWLADVVAASPFIIDHDWAWRSRKPFFDANFPRAIHHTRVLPLIHIFSYGAWSNISLIPIISNFHSEHIISGRRPDGSRQTGSPDNIYIQIKKKKYSNEKYNGEPGVFQNRFLITVISDLRRHLPDTDGKVFGVRSLRWSTVFGTRLLGVLIASSKSTLSNNSSWIMRD